MTLWFLLVACAGSGEGLDRFGRPRVPGLDTGLDPFFLARNTLDQRCARCHQGTSAPKGLDLRAAVSPAHLVGVPSREVPALLLVAPGDPEASYLWAKVAPSHGSRIGSRMPRDGPPYLDEAELDLLYAWIADGALVGE